MTVACGQVPSGALLTGVAVVAHTVLGQGFCNLLGQGFAICRKLELWRQNFKVDIVITRFLFDERIPSLSKKNNGLKIPLVHVKFTIIELFILIVLKHRRLRLIVVWEYIVESILNYSEVKIIINVVLLSCYYYVPNGWRINRNTYKTSHTL